MDQLTAMSWSEEIWGKASAKTIAHCWRHTQLVLSIDDNEYSSNGEPNIAIMDLAATFTQMSTVDLSMH
ncbi:hypothetical protein PHMEG_00023754 [Phytophthora megakarya]|uniref:Uncharacterized protein n=1 Tax=Phytophthora megakarya TaxID=4795 RepID=A0A225VG88_9STRA|nr:hypothetical protein PHMEG_00023754 [Phytophthora megakarya]